ncbi:MAG: CapA family protein [Acidobacteria bacterium]|nr:CapA family protein [Acidobacteriota bacterium]
MRNVQAGGMKGALRRQGRARTACAGVAIALSTLWWQPVAPTMSGQEPGPAARSNSPLSAERELAMKIKAPFTLAAVGDLIMRNPAGRLAEPAFANLLKPLQNADVAFANMEGNLIDFDHFPEPTGDGAPRAALADIQAMGVDIMSTANNHSLDLGVPGLLETIRALNEGGVVYAGTGRNLQEARAARFVNTPKGTVGLVSVYSVDPTSGPTPTFGAATYRVGNDGGRPGMNPLRVNVRYTVTAQQMEALRALRDSVSARRSEVFAPIPPVRPDEPKDRLELFGQRYKIGPKPGDMSWEVNPGDLREILRSIRNGKQISDFMIVTIHCHQGNYAFQTYTYDNDTPDFLIDFAHQAIEAGADVFIGHGVHTIRGVEIYKGKPIFYGVNSFIYQYMSATPQNPGGPQTEAETQMSAGSAVAERVSQPERFESLLTESRYENGRLVEVRVHPADLGQDGSRPFSRLGLPMIPAPDMAQRVLEKLQRLSKPFGTTISIENGVGVIRVPAGQSTAIRSSASR